MHSNIKQSVILLHGVVHFWAIIRLASALIIVRGRCMEVESGQVIDAVWVRMGL